MVNNILRSFHVKGLSIYLLNGVNGLRALQRVIKNILDNGSGARLRKFCEALDAYRQRVISEREAAATKGTKLTWFTLNRSPSGDEGA